MNKNQWVENGGFFPKGMQTMDCFPTDIRLWKTTSVIFPRHRHHTIWSSWATILIGLCVLAQSPFFWKVSFETSFNLRHSAASELQ